MTDDVAVSGRAMGEAAAEWSRSRRVRAGGWDVRYREAGRGPPVVLVHGLGMSADYWHRNAPPLAAAGFRVLAPDLPGFGTTDGPRRGLRIEDQAAATADFADAVGIGPAAFVGHSLSCQSVLELAAADGDRAAAVVLAAPTGDRRRGRRRREAWGLFRDSFQEPWALLVMAGLAYVRTGPLRYWGTWAGAREHDPFVPLAKVRCPGLVVVGTRDPVVPVEFAGALADGFPTGRLVVVDGGTHAISFSCPDAFQRAAVPFLRETLGG